MAIPVEIVVRGDVGPVVRSYAKRKVGRVTELIGDPIRSARVKLRVEPDPARDRPVIAQAVLDIDGTPLRAHTTAHDVWEALDLLEDRLRDQLEHFTERRLALRKRGAQARESREWRHGDAPARRPPYFDRPPDDRQLLRRKTFALHKLSAEEAVEEMDRLDYDFHLFIGADSGAACVVARRPDGRVAISSVGSLPPLPDWLVADPAPVPTLEETQALEHLNITDAPYVLYRDATTGTATVVYRRYDGHYGLITADAAAPALSRGGSH